MAKYLSRESAFQLSSPATPADWDIYYELRWRVLRQPWGQPRGSERDDLEDSAFHLMLRDPAGTLLAIGRLHLNSPQEAQIRYVAVDRAFEGHGLGGQI